MTREQRAVLAHVLVSETPDAWYARNVKMVGEKIAVQRMAAKVARWKPDYDAAVKREGVNYLTAVQREAQVTEQLRLAVQKKSLVK